MHYMKLTQFDTANGLGIGSVLWVCGCIHNCFKCHNPQTHDPSAGKLFDQGALDKLLESLNSPQITRLTFSGGDPLYISNRDEIHKIAECVKFKFPDKKIWLYTGYNFEEIINLPVLEFVDVLVDGRFIFSKRDVHLKYCGSTNQRIIDVQKTFQTGSLQLFNVDQNWI